MFAASVTVTKAREAKTWADSAFLEPGAQLSRPGSTCDPVRFRSERTDG